MEPDVVPDPSVAEIMALMGTSHTPESDDRLRAALGLPADYPILGAIASGPFALVWADNDPPRCSMRDGDTAEEIADFITCFTGARADPNCSADIHFIFEPQADGTLDIVGIDITCGDDTNF